MTTSPMAKLCQEHQQKLDKSRQPYDLSGSGDPWTDQLARLRPGRSASPGFGFTVGPQPREREQPPSAAVINRQFRGIVTSGILKNGAAHPDGTVGQDAGFRMLDAKQLWVALDSIKANAQSQVLCAPTLICNEGQQASLQTASDDLISISVTPAITTDGIKLEYQVEVARSIDNGGKTVLRSETKATLREGKALVQSGFRIGDRELVLILEADELKMAPTVSSISESGQIFGDRNVEAALADFDASQKRVLHGWERVLAANEQAPEQVVIKALIAEIGAGQPLLFNTPVPSSLLPIVRVIDGKQPQNETVQLYEIPAGEETKLVRRLSKTGEVQILSRPQIRTLMEQEAAIEIGQHVPVADGEDPFRGLRMKVTPTISEPGVVVVSAEYDVEPYPGGELQVAIELFQHFGGELPSTFKLGAFGPFKKGKSTLLVVDTHEGKKLLVALQADRVPAATVGQSPKAATKSIAPKKVVRVVGAVAAPGVYRLPQGGGQLINAIAMAGGLSPEAGDFVVVHRSAGSVPGDGVRLIAHEARSAETIRVSLRDVAEGRKQVGLRPGDRVEIEKNSNQVPGAQVSLFTRGYDVRGLRWSDPEAGEADPMAPDDIIRLIKESVAPESWARGRLEEVPDSCTLVVKQTLENHAAIQAKLAESRKQRGIRIDELTRSPRAYVVKAIVAKSNQPPAEALKDLQERITRIINPESFRNGENVIRANPQTQSLVIRADKETHKQIAELLKWVTVNTGTNQSSAGSTSQTQPLGFKAALSQVKNYELRIKRAEAELQHAREQKQDVETLERNLKSLRLQLKAARNLIRPRLDFAAQYNVSQFGRHLVDQSGPIAKELYATQAGVTPKNGSLVQPRLNSSAPSVRVYAVDKLVDRAGKPAENVLDELTDLIQTTIQPAHWDGNRNTVQPNLEKRSLVVRATAEIHNQIGQLLQQLRELSRLSARHYPVADLVTPPPGGEGTVASGVAELKARVRAIMPQTWKVAGGKNSVEFRQKTLSFIIRANAPVHDAVLKVLTGLRKRQPAQVTLGVSVFEVSAKSPDPAKKLKVQVADVKEVSLVGDDFDIGGNRIAAPRLTLFSGVTAEVRTDCLDMKFRAKVEGKTVVVTANVGSKTTSWVIPDGQTGLANITSAMGKSPETTGKRYYLAVKAAILPEAEEEELILGSPTAEPKMLRATPRGINIQEEEEELILGGQ